MMLVFFFPLSLSGNTYNYAIWKKYVCFGVYNSLLLMVLTNEILTFGIKSNKHLLSQNNILRSVSQFFHKDAIATFSQ